MSFIAQIIIWIRRDLNIPYHGHKTHLETLEESLNLD